MAAIKLEGKEGITYKRLAIEGTEEIHLLLGGVFLKQRRGTDLLIFVSTRQLCCTLRHCPVVQPFWLCLKPFN